MSDHDQDPESHEEVLPNAAADEFFGRMKRDFRRPKPSEEAIASALQAIQKLTGEFPVEHSFRSSPQASQEKCPKCGGENSASNRFCGYCGTLMQRPEEHVDPAAKDRDSSGQHVYHHHYRGVGPVGAAAGIAGLAIGTAGAIATAPFRDSYGYYGYDRGYDSYYGPGPYYGSRW